MQGCPTCHCNMIVSATDVLGVVHSYPERYVGHGLGGHTCRGSDSVQSVAITFNKANNEAGLSHFLFEYSFCLWLLGYSYVFFALQQNSKAVEGEDSSAPTFKHHHTESRPKHQALQFCSSSSRIHRQKTRTPMVESPVVLTPQVQILSTALSKYISNQIATAIPQCPMKTKPACNISYLSYRSLITGLVACPKTDSFLYGSHTSLFKTDPSTGEAEAG